VTPSSRAGWISTVAFAIVAVGGAFLLKPFVAHSHQWLLLLWEFGWVAVFLGIIIATGERFW